MSVILKPDQFNPVSRELTTGIRVNRATATLPQSGAGQEAIFTITGGRVLVVAVIGEVTTVVGGTTPSLGMAFNPTATGASTALCSDTAITADAVGTLWSIIGDFSEALATGLLVMESPGMVQTPFVLSEGEIEIDTTAADTTGAASWSIMYVPWDTGAEIAAA
jgi:hypothetical protein